MRTISLPPPACPTCLSRHKIVTVAGKTGIVIDLDQGASATRKSVPGSPVTSGALSERRASRLEAEAPAPRKLIRGLSAERPASTQSKSGGRCLDPDQCVPQPTTMIVAEW